MNFKQLLNCEKLLETFTYGQVQQIKRLKNHKSHGEDGDQGEVLKHVDISMIERIYLLLKQVWEKDTLPVDQRIAYIYARYIKYIPNI